MRIADKMQFEQVKQNVGKNRSQMQDLQNQAATQKRVTKPSDDPLAASRVLGNRIDLQSNQQFTKSLGYAKSFLEITDQALNDVSEVVMRAKELAINQANDASGNEETRRVVATEIEQLHNSLISIGNRKLGDRFIFGGYKTTSAPFDVKGKYIGDLGEMNIHMEKETFMPMNIPGSRVFLGIGVNAEGMVKQAPPQARSIDEFEQQQLKAQGQPAPQTQSQQPAMRGPASLHANKLLTEQLINPDAGHQAEPIDESMPTGTNLFHVMKDLEVSLRTNDKAGVQDSLDRLDDALSQVVLTRAQVGSRGMRLDNLIQTTEKTKVENQAAISTLEDADVFSTVSDINKTESTLQATLATSGKLIEKSLIDFLR
jgi:flagellar hook-associated protein 3 FlgL